MRINQRQKIILLAFALACIHLPMLGDVKLASVFGSHMVLQRNSDCRIWGNGDAGEEVKVSFNGQTRNTIVGKDRSWSVTLSPMQAGGPFNLQVNGRNSITLEDVLVGDVWIASGQSNMEFQLSKTNYALADIAASDNSMIRLFHVKRTVAEVPQKECVATWRVCNPSSVENFSAVAYYFGKQIQSTTSVPVGLIQSTWGGTSAEAWTSMGVLEADADFTPILDRWSRAMREYPDAKKKFDAEYPALMAKWRQDSAVAKMEGKIEPRKPQEPIGPGNRSTPAGLYNGMIAPLIRFAMKGVIWYQGESNAGRAYQYRKLFPALINDWRTQWGIGDFPFLYVQLPNLDREPEPSRSGWAELREAQLMTLSVPNTGMAVTIDVGDPLDLHPANKKPVGERLAIAAEATAYGRSSDFMGPIYRSMTIEDRKVRIVFDQSTSGLTQSGKHGLKGFQIAGPSRIFVPAQAKIEGSKVVVWSDEISTPVAVRYAWGDNPSCNLYNGTGLPASPFRTDDWPGVTFGKK